MILKFQNKQLVGEITVDDDANTRDHVDAFTAALIAEGFGINSIISAYQAIAEELGEADGHRMDV